MCVDRAYQSIMAFENVLKVFGIPSTERTESTAFIFFFKICFNVIHSRSCFENDSGVFWLDSSENMLTDLTYYISSAHSFPIGFI